MSELEFSSFFNELLLYMDKQEWNHLNETNQELEDQLTEFERQLDQASDEENQLRDELREKDKSIMDFKNSLGEILNKLR